MVLSLATCKIESCPCGDLHVITAALVGLFFPFVFYFLQRKEANRVRRCLSGIRGPQASCCPGVPMACGRAVLRGALSGTSRRGPETLVRNTFHYTLIP